MPFSMPLGFLRASHTSPNMPRPSSRISSYCCGPETTASLARPAAARLPPAVAFGGPISPRRRFSPARGGLLCEACAAAEPGAVTLSADALAGLSLLLSRPVCEAGDWLGLAEVRRTGEILRAVEAFLRHHFQRFQGLRSLEVLRSLPGSDPARDTPCPA